MKGVCQRPERAYFISTEETGLIVDDVMLGVNALNGLTSFLRYPLKPLENTGFPASFLQVFVRLFWKQLFSADFLACYNLFIFRTDILPILSTSLYLKIKEFETLFCYHAYNLILDHIPVCTGIIMVSLLFSAPIKSYKPKRQIPYNQYQVHQGKPSGKRSSRNCIENKKRKNKCHGKL